jgi:hypothetical protein
MRFLGSFRRLKRRIEKCEAEHLGGDLGPALAHYGQCGELPQNPWLRAQIERIEATVRTMAQTMPGPVLDQDSQ